MKRFILISALLVASAFGQSGPVTKNPNTGQIREDLKFGTGRTLTMESGATLTGAGTFDLSAATATFADNQIGWAKVSKTGSSLADLATRSASDLSSGTLPDARLSANVSLLGSSIDFTSEVSGKPTTLTGYGITDAELKRSVNVIEHGAIGDGSADDTDEIQAAIDAASEGGTIIIPRGYNFKLTYTILLKEGQTLTGGGTLTYNPASDDDAAISNLNGISAAGYEAAGNITIEDLTVNAPTGNCIGVGHAKNITIRNIRSTAHYWHVVDAVGCKDLLVDGIRSDNSIATNINGSAIEIDAATATGSLSIRTAAGTRVLMNADDTASMGVIVRNSVVRNPQSFGLHLHRSGHVGVTFENNITDGCTHGAVISETSTTSTDVILTNNQFLNNTSYGVYASGGVLIRTKIVGNVVDTAPLQGIWLELDSGSLDVDVSGNTVRNFAGAAVRILNTTGFVIANNVIKGSTAGANGRGISVVDSITGTVSGNSVHGDQTNGNSHGIYLVSGSGIESDVSVTGNSIRGWGNGVYVAANAVNVSVSGNTVYDIYSRGIAFTNGTGNTYALNCSITGNSVHRTRITGILIDNGSYCTISGNSVLDPTYGGNGTAGRGIQLAIGGTPNAGSYNVVANNVLDGGAASPNETSQIGIYIATAYTIIDGNTVSRFKTGLQDTGSPAGLVLTGNIARANGTNSSVAAAGRNMGLNWFGDQSTPTNMPPFQLVNSGGPHVTGGAGSPEGVVTALKGSIFLRTDGGASTSIYVKESGTGNTGWVAK